MNTSSLSRRASAAEPVEIRLAVGSGQHQFAVEAGTGEDARRPGFHDQQQWQDEGERHRGSVPPEPFQKL